MVVTADLIDVVGDLFGQSVPVQGETAFGRNGINSTQECMASHEEGDVFHAFFLDDDLTFAQLKDADMSSLKSNFTPKHPR